MISWEQTDSALVPPDASPAASGRASGRWVVVGMLIFGIVATAGLWLYWELHTRPFRPLQEALVQEFPGSSPRVQGGQRKIHEHTPRVLQVVMRVDFNPVADESQARRVAAHVVELARRHTDRASYTRIEVGLFQPLAEQDPRMRTVRVPLP